MTDFAPSIVRLNDSTVLISGLAHPCVPIRLTLSGRYRHTCRKNLALSNEIVDCFSCNYDHVERRTVFNLALYGISWVVTKRQCIARSSRKLWAKFSQCLQRSVGAQDLDLGRTP